MHYKKTLMIVSQNEQRYADHISECFYISEIKLKISLPKLTTVALLTL